MKLLINISKMVFLALFCVVCTVSGQSGDVEGITTASMGVIAGDLSKMAYNFLMEGGYLQANQQITEGYLRLEANLQNNTGNYTIDFEAAKGSGDRPLETKLKDGEVFHMVAIGVGVQVADDLIGTNQAHNPVLRTPNLVPAADQPFISALFNGSMTFTVEQQVEYDKIPMSLFRFDTPLDTLHGAEVQESGFHFLSPGYGFKSNEDNKVTIQLPPNTDLSGLKGATKQNVLVIELYGFRTKGLNTKAGFLC